MTENNKISNGVKDIILMPTFNERENVKILIPRIFSLLPQISILVIDDNSPDGTAGAVKSMMRQYPNLSILERSQKTGLGDAYKEGIRKVIADSEIRSVITMDADGSHDPIYLSQLLNKIQDSDLVIGSRYVPSGGIESWEYWRKNLSKFGNLYAKFFTGLPLNDLTAGFMCIRRECLQRIDLAKISSAGYSFLIELKFYLIKKAKAKAVEVPIIFKSRFGGESKLSHQIIREGIKTPLRFFWLRLWRKI